MIKILIAEDSSVVALLLKTILENEPDMEVIGHAKDGREAVQMAHQLKPDLITMDIRMPIMDGFDATRMIMADTPTPIVVVSSHVDSEELRTTFRAIEEGALAVLEKPRGFNHPNFEQTKSEMVNTVRAMAEVKVIRRTLLQPITKLDIFEAAILQKTKAYEVIALGCSTGGPQILQQVLSALPVGMPIPIIITQHISKGFISGLVQWMRSNTLLDVELARDGEYLKAGTIYFAPDDFHFCISRNGNGLRVNLNQGPPVNGFRPSATVLLQSVARICPGHAVGGLLSGMGGDGAQGLLEARQAGCHTFVQDEKSAIVYGMPGTAIALDAVDQVVKLDKIAAYLTGLARQ